MSNHVSIARKSKLIVLLAIGFYALALLFIGLLVIAIYLIVRSGGLFSFPTLICAIAAGIILFSILPKRDPFEPPGPELTREAYPQLFDLIDGIAARAEQPPMDEVFLTMYTGAFVGDRLQGMFTGRRRVMGIGLPLMMALNVSEFASVVAHEFGHYHAGDIRFGPWIHKTRIAIKRTIENLDKGSAYIDVPFRLYGRLFMRVSSVVSRHQELVADRFAARMTGGNIMGQALQKLEKYRWSVTAYWDLLLEPALRYGLHPPVIDGCRVFIETLDAGKVAPPLQIVVEERAPDMYDSHPPTEIRLQELEGIPVAKEEDPAPAVSLLGDTGQLEPDIFSRFVWPVAPEEFENISWEDYARRAYIDRWSYLLEIAEPVNVDVTFAELPGWLELRYRTLNFDSLTTETEDPISNDLLGLEAGIASTLFADGWEFHAHPSRLGVCFQKGEDSFLDPARLLMMLLNNSMDLDEWRSLFEKYGLADKRLIFEPIRGPSDSDVSSPPL